MSLRTMGWPGGGRPQEVTSVLVAAGLVVLSVGQGLGCDRGREEEDAPLPSRIFSSEDAIQPVKLPEVRDGQEEESATIKPPPGGDPDARAVVLGRKPVESVVRKREDGRLQVGKIIVDPDEGEMILPGEINQTHGIVEYLAVGPKGKRHESVLMLAVHALNFQIACILLGLEPAPMKPQEDPDLLVTRKGEEEPDPAAPEVTDRSGVYIEVTWKEGDEVVTHRAEDLTWNRESETTMPRGKWVYTGSSIFKGVLSAEFSQSYIATWPDRSALFNTPVVTHNPYRGNGMGFEANFSILPPKGTPIRMTIRRAFDRDAK